ncbi:DUF4251 domain-containing protein [Pedobacter frigoris]|uniref:DUF4251 domain-containing protein n=2 Tax=Pedobacter frigoris TaxID=2571272 RepID=A0A4U1CJV1_9SPHI|nr:DUF4251 domain-containing protein [Pedobacter frigoris]
MKTLKNLLILAAVFTTMQVSAQTDKETTTRLVNAKTLKFNATSAQPLAVADLNAVLSKMPGGLGGGGSIQLSGSSYDLKISKDSVEAYLPYFGRAYTANLNPNDSGIKFKSKNFTYKSEQKKKGNWVITIKPKDTKDAQELMLTIGTNGYAFLSVNSNNRQSISYMGYISDPADKK